MSSRLGINLKTHPTAPLALPAPPFALPPLLLAAFACVVARVTRSSRPLNEEPLNASAFFTESRSCNKARTV
jgi:hypothetical protein